MDTLDTGQDGRAIASPVRPLDRLTSRLSAAYKGINVLVLREGAQDFFWKADIRELDAEKIELDIHHIFPRDWCDKQRIPRKNYNAIVNKTPISYKANRMIGGTAPSQYLQRLQQHKQVLLDDAGMNAILKTHLISPAAMRNDNFSDFYQERKQALLGLIEAGLGYMVSRGRLRRSTREEQVGNEQTAELGEVSVHVLIRG